MDAGNPGKPAVSNLIEIYAVFADEAVETIENRYAGVGYGSFKQTWLMWWWSVSCRSRSGSERL
ncbi:hypothetical protein [Paenibacillus sp. 1P07SE]|uniref:hypothetical protein n=1 Tax=Paenibacillus sp. 1P07SE TaxID=3132209 RepID=UPI0039A6E5E5